MQSRPILERGSTRDSGGLANDELDIEHEAPLLGRALKLGHRLRDAPPEALKQELRHQPSLICRPLTDGGERWSGDGGHLGVIESHNGDVFGYATAGRTQRPHCPQRHHVGGNEKRVDMAASAGPIAASTPGPKPAGIGPWIRAKVVRWSSLRNPSSPVLA